MKFIKKFFATIGGLIVIIIVLALLNWWYLGGFKKLEVKEQNMGPYIMAYVEHTGSYSLVGESMDIVYKALSGEGIAPTMGIGIYYDDPSVVAEENLRSDMGAIIDTSDVAKIKNIADIKVKKLDAKQSIVITFPIKNSVSYIAGMIKVYPILKKYMQEKGYAMQVPIMELYDTTAKKIYYTVEITK